MFTGEEHSREHFNKPKKAKLDEIKQVVCAYLQKRNYPSTVPSKTSVSEKEFAVTAMVENEISRPNSILYSCINNDPPMTDQTFTNFVTWVKDLVKAKGDHEDLEALIGPLFCHFFFEILRGGHIERAYSFYKTYLSMIDQNKCDKAVIELINALGQESDTDETSLLKENFRNGKYTVQLSSESVNLLRKFLEHVGHMVLLQVLQNWFIIEEMVEQGEEMDGDGCDLEDNVKIDVSPKKDTSTEDLLNIINAVNKTSPKPVYCVNIGNVKDELTCGVLSRAHGLFAYSYNNCVILRSLETLQQLQSSLVLGEIMLIGHSGRVYDMIVFNNHLLSCSQDKTMRLYNLNDYSEKSVYFGHDYPIYCLCASRNNDFFVSGSYDRTARLWSISRKDNLRIFIGHTQEVTSVDFHPNSNYIMSGSADKNIKMWAISNAEPVRSFPGSTGTVYSVCFSPDGKYLFSSGEDGKLRIWDLQAGKQLINIRIGDECATKIAVSTNESQVAVASIDGTVKIWNYERIVNELQIEDPILNLAFRPKLLSLDYHYGCFGCLSTYQKWSKPKSKFKKPV